MELKDNVLTAALLASFLLYLWASNRLRLPSTTHTHLPATNSKLSANHFTATTKHSTVRTNQTNQKFKLHIFVFGYDRLTSFERLLDSLVAADYLGHTVTCSIFLDIPEAPEPKPDPKASKRKQAGPVKLPPPLTNAEAREVFKHQFRHLEWLRDNAKWPHGDLFIHKRESHRGLKGSIMEAWYPLGDNEFGAFFEDDIEVSPFWYKWVAQALDTYYFIPDRPEKLLGLALYRPIHDELTARSMIIDNENAPFLLQQPCSWGAVYFPRQWQLFRDYFSHNPGNPTIPLEISSNSWGFRTSWKKYLFRHMWNYGLFMVYPNLPEQKVLSTNHMLPGVHIDVAEKINQDQLKRTELALFMPDDFAKFPDKLSFMPPWKKLHIYNIVAKRVPGVEKLRGAQNPLPLPD
eukprot:TRINITY_DN52836_c0_g1_i1.p1 TRINITY_DN52836_c0_g1~~TRINITY_DN52836_c0_g1_i1.p1  ORF type:complete len:405 (+),score=10.81 TRINITY_DN52836_c0_g1_i1:44-1258(+)